MGKSIASAFVILIALAACNPQVDEQGIATEIGSIMSQQEQAWNEGDIPAFMEPYWHSDSMAFVGNEITYGWQATLDNYLKGYPNKEQMGTLKFDNVAVEVLSQDAAFVLGKWQLSRTNIPDKSGHYSLLWKRVDGKWQIVTDHSS